MTKFFFPGIRRKKVVGQSEKAKPRVFPRFWKRATREPTANPPQARWANWPGAFVHSIYKKKRGDQLGGLPSKGGNGRGGSGRGGSGRVASGRGASGRGGSVRGAGSDSLDSRNASRRLVGDSGLQQLACFCPALALWELIELQGAV